MDSLPACSPAAMSMEPFTMERLGRRLCHASAPARGEHRDSDDRGVRMNHAGAPFIVVERVAEDYSLQCGRCRQLPGAWRWSRSPIPGRIHRCKPKGKPPPRRAGCWSSTSAARTSSSASVRTARSRSSSPGRRCGRQRMTRRIRQAHPRHALRLRVDRLPGAGVPRPDRRRAAQSRQGLGGVRLRARARQAGAHHQRRRHAGDRQLQRRPHVVSRARHRARARR